ncbi:RagB/SusD family nutrient uptake outer membrane protein [Pedobacter petrophilus]|uniref:RagB/SusD family nutrient uptake outer membrane protein n=1 Tax=Pedobacter petrophilus TaxID=1908241 RepID=A0A7K0G3Z1_9SPHI|nr:RagB/SusD family nutrient uptake outer membrane protein [Pedobacter petrophilus]MRX78160.1 RagB/SusD family nutrient uptake outer membrane protein [Pedobacter petrophilus]
MQTISKNITTLLLLSVVFSFGGCKKFLSVTPSTQSVNPVTIKDFQEILNSDSLSRTQFFPLDLMTDDVALTDNQFNTGDNFYRRIYTWDALIWNPAQIDFMYNYSYAKILQMNVILSRIDAAKKDALNTPQTKNLIVSQALTNRAWYYLQLVNTYGAAYDVSTSKTDPGVPLVLTPDAYALPARASVEQVYGSIISDLKKAAANTDMPSKGIDIIHPGKAAVYGLLARTYLYKGDYESASLFADSALTQESRLLDLTQNPYMPNQLQDLNTNPEVLLGRISSDEGFFKTYSNTFVIGGSLLDSLGGFSTADKRFSNRFSTSRFSPGVYKQNQLNAQTMVFDNSVAVPEIMLIKAECLARKGDFSAAGDLLDKLRSSRIINYSPSGRTYTADNILSYVIGERRRELCFHGGLRLFDLKRFNKGTPFRQSILRTSYSGTNYAELLPGSVLYLLPLSAYVLAANPNILQNPR